MSRLDILGKENRLSASQTARISRLLEKRLELRRKGLKQKTYDLASPYENKLSAFKTSRDVS